LHNYNMTGHLIFVKTYFERAEKRKSLMKCDQCVIKTAVPAARRVTKKIASLRFHPLCRDRTSGKLRMPAMKPASKGEVLSFLQTSDSGSGIFRSLTEMMTTRSGHRQRAVPLTHPTPMPCETRLRMVASLTASWTMRGDLKPPR